MDLNISNDERINIIGGRKLIDCLSIHEKIKSNIKTYLEVECKGFKPLLTIISLEDNQINRRCIQDKLNVCNEVGIQARHITLPKTITESDLIRIIRDYQEFSNAIIVQLPKGNNTTKFNKVRVIAEIDPLKDVEGVTPINVGLLHSHLLDKALVPTTIQGVMGLFESLNYDLSGKRVLVIGRGGLMGKSLLELLLQKDAGVSLVHSKTKTSDLKMATHGTSKFIYDVIISTIGKPLFIKNAKAGMLIDIGANELNGSLVGDIDLSTCRYNYATSLSEGLSLCTTAYLLQNVVKACKLQGVI